MTLVPDYVQENYAQVREQRGWTWQQMADQFARDGYRDLEAWARGLTTEDRAKPQRREKAINKPRETR